MSNITHDIQLLGKRTKENIKTLYLQNNKRVLTLGYSGGKDSSLCASLLIEALMEIPSEQRIKDVYILFSDTLMELLPVQVHTYKVLERIRAFALKNNLPIKILHAKPKLEHTMWSMIIGSGVRPSSRDNRWCTDRLKILVQQEILTKTFGTTNVESVSIVGSRREESVDRAQRLEEKSLEGHLKGHSVFDKTLVYAPIEYFTTEDVWRELRVSKYGNSVLYANELWELYASTNGEGEECQTILGNANENGSNPGCANSGGRFGCWCCPLVHQKDKALVGMMTSYSYIKYLIDFRNYVVNLRDGNWHLYRDYYNHRAGERYQYSYDNHRFGMTVPGGLNLKTRKELLRKLLDTEQKIQVSEPDIKLISDEELMYIQKRWVNEGDFEFSAEVIARDFNRTFEISSFDKSCVSLAKKFMEKQNTWNARIVYWFNIYPDNRFAIQFIKQMLDKHSLKQMLELIKEIHSGNKRCVADALLTLPLKNSFFPNDSMKKSIMREWENDETGHCTKQLLSDFLDEHDDENDEYYDEFDDPNISMEDKFNALDNWRWYQNGSDDAERKAHPEYTRYKNNYNYITFRDKLEKPSEKKKKKKPANLFDFAAS